MTKFSGNALLVQLGQPSTLMNAGLSTLVSSILNCEAVNDIYGCIDGLAGLTAGTFIDLAAQQRRDVSNLAFTPGAALGSRVMEYSDREYGDIVSVLSEKNIKFMFVLGDEKSGECCMRIEAAAAKSGHEMHLMLIPFSPSNSLPLTDHCLGYGSMIKHISVLFANVIAHVQSTQSPSSVTVVEFSECKNAWILGGVALAKKYYDSPRAPNLIFTDLFDEQTLVSKVHKCIHENGSCVVVVGGALRNRAGESVTGEYSPGEYVKFIIGANFEIDVDLVVLADWMRTSCMTISGIDFAETADCAKRAVELVFDSAISGKMMILLRSESIKYGCEVSCVDIANTLGKEKNFPENWYSSTDAGMDPSFFKYASPLIAGEIYPTYEAGIPTLAKFR
jgi:6-phosphofructokinase 1